MCHHVSMDQLAIELVNKRILNFNKFPAKMLLGTSHHAAAIFVENKTSLSCLSIGMNRYTNHKKSTHAENSAISRLKYRETNKKKKVDILVIKTSKSGRIGNSKPCYHCLMDLKRLSPERGYRINNVYYSNSDGIIVKKKLSHLILEGNFHFSSYYRNLQ